MNPLTKEEEILIAIIESIVTHPDDVHVNRSVDNMGVLLTLRVHKEDMGIVIGRHGSTAEIIKQLLKIVGLRVNSRVAVKIEEPI